MKYKFPLRLSFKLIALAPRVSVQDAQKQEIFYIEQKVFALKEAIKVFNNQQDKKLLYTIKANQIIDFGAQYFITSADGKSVIGSVQQEGVRSLFRGAYKVFDKHDKEVFTVTQTNPWISFVDSLLNLLPFAELVTGFILFPTYEVTGVETKHVVLHMKKNPSLFESLFTISNEHSDMSEDKELLLLLSLLMIVQLEQNRG